MSKASSMSGQDIFNEWATDFCSLLNGTASEERLARLKARRDPEGLENDDDEYDEDGIDFDIGEQREGDQTQLAEVGIKILEGQASNEDYKIVRDMAAKYLPGEMFKFSPRLMGREASLESIEQLKQYAGAGVAVAIVLALIALIDSLFSGDSKGGSSGGSMDKKIKRLEQVTEQYQKAAENLAKATTVKHMGVIMSKINQKDIELIMSSDTNKDTLRALPLYKSIADTIGRQASLSEVQLDEAVINVIKLARKYAKLLGVEDYSKLKPHFEKGLDLHYSMATDVFLDGRNRWARMSFLSANGFEPSKELGIVHDKLKNAVEVFSGYREKIDEFIRHLETKNQFDIAKYQGVLGAALEQFGIDAVAAGSRDTNLPMEPTKTLMTINDANELNASMKAYFQPLEPNQVVVKNVLSKIIGADQAKLIAELEKFDEIGDASITLKKWLEKNTDGSGSLVEVMKKLEELKVAQRNESLNNSLIEPINRSIRLLQTIAKLSGTLITAAGNFDRGVERFSVEVANFMKVYQEIGEIAGKLDRIERTASSESILEDKTGNLPVNNEVGFNYTAEDWGNEFMPNHTAVPPEEPNFAMREIHIPSNVILPHGIDHNSLRDLVEEDSSKWTRAELDEFVETAQASLESLYTDIDQISAIHHRIRRTGLICRDDVQQLEVIHPGLITSQTPIGRFTSFESVNYARPSLEAAGNLAAGAQAVAGVAAIAILAKILQWCYKRFQASRDVTKSIKGSVDVIGKLNDQTIATVTGMNQRVEALKPDMKGKLNEEAKKYFSDKMLSNNWYNIQDTEKSMMQLRVQVFVKLHDKHFSELIDSMIKGEDAFKLVQALTTACEKGAATLDKAVDNVATQIEHLKSDKGGNGSTDFSFKGLDYGLDGFRIKDLDLSKSQGNVGRAELITAYVQTKKDAKLTKEQLGNVEIDKMNARMVELAQKLKEVNGRVDSDFKKIQQRLDKLEKANAAASEKDDSEGSATANREAVKSYIKSIQAEFNAYSKIVGAQKAILTVLDAEIKKYGTTLKEWNTLVNWHSKKVASLSKEGGEE